LELLHGRFSLVFGELSDDLNDLVGNLSMLLTDDVSDALAVYLEHAYDSVLVNVFL
jgi:hypothetical protein